MNDQTENTTAVLTLEQILTAIGGQQPTLSEIIRDKHTTQERRLKALAVYGGLKIYEQSQTASAGKFLIDAYNKWLE